MCKYSFLLVFLGVFNKATAYTLNGFSRKIRQKTLFRVRKCLSEVTMTIF